MTSTVGASSKRPKRGGRVKGTPNKTTAQLKDMILGALDEAGGVTYLKNQAKKNPAAFLTLVGKVLPMTLTSDPNAPVKVEFSWKQQP